MVMRADEFVSKVRRYTKKTDWILPLIPVTARVATGVYMLVTNSPLSSARTRLLAKACTMPCVVSLILIRMI